MKTQILKPIFFIAFLFVSTTVCSQDIPKYDYLEVIVIQKANNRGKVKRIKVEEQASLVGKQITIKALEKLKNTSDLLGYMNNANWEFLERQAVVSGESDPVWMSYIFRKRK